jgi:hypothetical protein
VKASIVLNERGTQLRLEAENEFESALIEFMDFDYTASVLIEKEHQVPYQWDKKRKVLAATFNLIRNTKAGGRVTGDIVAIEGKFIETVTAMPSYNITFHNGSGVIGKLDFNGPEMVFTGNAEESAKVFFDWIAKSFAGRLAEERERATHREMNTVEVKMKPDLLKACKAALCAMEESVKVGCTEYLDQWDERHIWDGAIERLKAAITNAERATKVSVGSE